MLTEPGANGATAAPRAMGRVAAVRGSVVEIVFPGEMSAINEPFQLRDGGRPLVLEVAHHIDPHSVRAIALTHTEGLARGLPVARTGRPITVPVGPATLGRLFNALGEPLDGQSLPAVAERRPIHRSAPALTA